MKVLSLGGYDAILGMDWLARWGLMNCHFADKWVAFQYAGRTAASKAFLMIKQL